MSKDAIGLVQAMMILASAQENPPGVTGPVPLDDHPQDIAIEFWKNNRGWELPPVQRKPESTLPPPDSFYRSGEWMTFFNNHD